MNCSCGALWHDPDPELFRQSAALVSTYMFGDESAFIGLLSEVSQEIVPVLVCALYAALHLIADEQGCDPYRVLRLFCRSAESMAIEIEAER